MEILPDLRKILGDKWDIMSATKVSGKWVVKARGAGHYEDFAVFDWIPGKEVAYNGYFTTDMAAADQEFQCRVGKGGVSCPSVRGLSG